MRKTMLLLVVGVIALLAVTSAFAQPLVFINEMVATRTCDDYTGSCTPNGAQKCVEGAGASEACRYDCVGGTWEATACGTAMCNGSRCGNEMAALFATELMCLDIGE